MAYNFIDAITAALQPKESLPLRQSYGQRYNPETDRLDAPDSKSFGFYGPIKNPGGDIVSEYSSNADIGGKDTGYPNIFPGMTQAQLVEVLNAAAFDRPVSQATADAAYDSAAARVAAGKSPFWDPRVDPFPKWSPDQEWPKP